MSPKLRVQPQLPYLLPVLGGSLGWMAGGGEVEMPPVGDLSPRGGQVWMVTELPFPDKSAGEGREGVGQGLLTASRVLAAARLVRPAALLPNT